MKMTLLEDLVYHAIVTGEATGEIYYEIRNDFQMDDRWLQ
jgi:hypothetical protein